MHHITTSNPTSNTVKSELEHVIDTHTVTANLRKEDTHKNTVKWTVTCTDCGKSTVLTLTVNPHNLTIPTTPIEAFQTRPCTPSSLPTVDTGSHTVHVGDELPTHTGTRACSCSDCGRTINIPLNNTKTKQYLNMFSTMPCQDTYTDIELGTAVIHPDNPTAPQRNALHLSNWQYEPQITHTPTTGYWWHENLPLLITINTTNNTHNLQISFLPQPLVNSSIHDYDITRADTDIIEELTYGSTNTNGEIETHYETIVDVLRFMQYVNDMTETDTEYQQLRSAAPLTLFELILQQNNARLCNRNVE